MPMPYACVFNAPEHINVFTDGSWLYSLEQFLGLGGAGVWWPGRTLHNKQDGTTRIPISTAEHEMALHVVEEGGVRLYTRIGGFTGSSTRTELAAGIIAICAHGPVHIGSDSEVFVNAANAFLNEIKIEAANGNLEKLRKQKTSKHKWKLMHDGDLWEHFYRAVVCKGPNAVRLTWVKGHATQDHIDKNITTLVNKIGNDKADDTADLGTSLHGEDIVLVAKCLHARHAAYQLFMKHVSQHIVEAYMVHRALMDIIEQEEAKQKRLEDTLKVTYTKLSYPTEDSCDSLKNSATIHDYNKFNNKNNIAKHIEHFLANAKVAELC